MENLQLWALSWSYGSASDRAQQNYSGPLFYHHLASATSFPRDMKYVSSSSLPHAAGAADSTGAALGGDAFCWRHPAK